MARDFEPVTASTPKQREVLLEQVKAHVTAELVSRQRKARVGAKGRTERRLRVPVDRDGYRAGCIVMRLTRTDIRSCREASSVLAALSLVTGQHPLRQTDVRHPV
jgi:hypothetical protein